MSSASGHWTRFDVDMCPRLDTCPYGQKPNPISIIYLETLGFTQGYCWSTLETSKVTMVWYYATIYYGRHPLTMS